MADEYAALMLVLSFAFAALTATVGLQVWRRQSLAHIRWFAAALTLAMLMRLRDLVYRGLDWPSLIVLIVVMCCVIRGLMLLPEVKPPENGCP